jgi:hypothetical protein
VAVIAGADGLGRVGEGCEEGAAVENLKEQDENRDTDGCLDLLAKDRL